jgi:hypothetical protein
VQAQADLEGQTTAILTVPRYLVNAVRSARANRRAATTKLACPHVPPAARPSWTCKLRMSAGQMRSSGVAVGKVDEILNLATRSGAEVSDQLKYFAERLPATFAYTSIEL